MMYHHSSSHMILLVFGLVSLALLIAISSNTPHQIHESSSNSKSIALARSGMLQATVYNTRQQQQQKRRPFILSPNQHSPRTTTNNPILPASRQHTYKTPFTIQALSTRNSDGEESWGDATRRSLEALYAARDVETSALEPSIQLVEPAVIKAEAKIKPEELKGAEKFFGNQMHPTEFFSIKTDLNFAVFVAPEFHPDKGSINRPHWSSDYHMQSIPPSPSQIQLLLRTPNGIIDHQIAQFTTPTTHMFSLFDSKVGQECSFFLAKNLDLAVRAHASFEGNILTALREAHHIANNQYYGHVLDDGISTFVGAESVSLVVRENRLYSAIVGHGKVLVIRKRVQENPVMDWVSPKFNVIEMGGTRENVPTPELPSAHDGCPPAGSRGFGNFECKATLSVDPELSQLVLSPQDRFFVVGTEAMWRVITAAEVAAVVSAVGPNTYAISRHLITLAKNRGVVESFGVAVIDAQTLSRSKMFGGVTKRQHAHHSNAL